jgi:putative aldouronate transport system substrate-binding protein
MPRLLEGHADHDATRLSRRRMLGLSAGGAAALAGLGPTVGAQTLPATPGPADGRIPSPAPGVPDAFTTFPQPYRSVDDVPGNGGTVSAFNITYQPPVPGRSENAFWQELERRLGVTLEMTQAPAAGYEEKLATLTAGGDLPDITFLVGPSPVQLRLIEQGAYADLTPYLTGDALAEYPNLARLPAKIWANAAIQGKLYGTPRPLFLTGGTLVFRQDWAEKAGIPRPADAEDFFRLMVSFTEGDPDGNGQADTWGLADQGAMSSYALGWLQQMFRVPNGWRRNADGSLTHAIETEEFGQAIAFARRLFEAGVFHPDAGTMTNAQANDAFSAGRLGAFPDGLPSLPGSTKGKRNTTKQSDPAANVIGLVPPGHDGGAAVTHNAIGFFGIAAIPATVGEDPERVRELLRILNFYAAPFGSEEWLFLNYGLEGMHHTLQPDGSPVITEQGKLELGDLWALMSGERVFYYDVPGDAVYMQDLVRDLLAIGVDNPTWGLFSETYLERGQELAQFLHDEEVAIIAGREPLASLDGMIGEWRSRGGDDMRREYEEALRG